MGFRISTNTSSIAAARQLTGNRRKLEKSMQQLSSGKRINQAADDAAGLSVSESMRSTLRSMSQAVRNANDGISLIQTAEGGLNEISNIVIRLRELGVQSASDTIGANERQFIQKEVTQLSDEIERIGLVTKWGKSTLLDGSANQFDIQVGIMNDEFEDRIAFDPSQNRATLSGLELSGLDFTDKPGAQTALEKLDSALIQVNSMRSNLGSIETRLVHTIENSNTYIENMASAKSRIVDTDVAQATSELASTEVMLNAAISVLAQANATPRAALKLIG